MRSRAELRREAMISYKKLWHVLSDKDLKKKDLVTLAGVSSYTINKLNRGDNVTTDVLQRICRALDVGIGDIMEVLPDEDE
jgi:DNA-binding Xre family transcriptional regulator